MNNTKRNTQKNNTPVSPNTVALTKITHHGAVDGVTGSCHQLHFLPEFNDSSSSVLIDCGLFQGAETSNGASAE